MKFPRPLFDRLAEKALAEIPKAFLDLLYNVEIDVRELPGKEAGKWNGSRKLLGLYKGLSRAEMKSPGSGTYHPARIVLYQTNIEERCGTEAELFKVIRKTLRHELAHHFGFSEEDIRQKWPEGA